MLTLTLRKYLRPYKRSVWLVLLLLLVQAIANLYLPTLNAELINNGVVKGDIGYILRSGLIMLAASGLVIIASVVLAYLSSRVSMGFGRDLRRDVFTAVESFSARELNHFGAPSLITRNTNDVQQVQMVLFLGLTMMLGAPITGIGAVIMALRTNVRLSALLLVAVPLMAIMILFLLRRVVPLFRSMQLKIDRINLVLREQISGVRVIRAFVKTKHEEARFDLANTDLTRTTLTVTRTFAIMFPSLTLILNLSSVAVIWFGGKLVNSGQMPIGNLTAFLAYIMQILVSVMMAVMMSLMIPRAEASAERIMEVLDTESSVIDAVNPKAPVVKNGRIEFRDVEFRYPGAEQAVLSGITFTAEPGQVTAIVGGTGSGKSTLVNLIPRFIDVTGGSLMLDGIDIREQSLEEVWSGIGLVPQRAFLFGGTIAENLRYGDPQATDEDLWRALEIAQAKDFVDDLADKLSSHVAQGGTNLSGGQRQRLSIARAIVKNPRVFILDDSFSALDYSTDSKLRAALASAASGATMIVIAQRISTILGADQIIVLENGLMAGLGTHQELMNDSATYREIVLSQLSPDEAA
ncbi:MAG TPA: ABC transporter ATP-binding protein [Candidatus Nanopelagicaceae bacterium]|nr:ABC transporter ATP-binding protein [Candidatus Nanopelagicaceae bacterium]